MLTTILIATIIHMNMGFELPEAFWRGVGSAAIIAAIGVAVMIIVGIAGLIVERINK